MKKTTFFGERLILILFFFAPLCLKAESEESSLIQISHLLRESFEEPDLEKQWHLNQEIIQSSTEFLSLYPSSKHVDYIRELQQTTRDLADGLASLILFIHVAPEEAMDAWNRTEFREDPIFGEQIRDYIESHL